MNQLFQALIGILSLYLHFYYYIHLFFTGVSLLLPSQMLSNNEKVSSLSTSRCATGCWRDLYIHVPRK